MLVLLKLLELLVEERVDCTIEAGLVADVADVVDDEMAAGESGVVVVGGVYVD